MKIICERCGRYIEEERYSKHIRKNGACDQQVKKDRKAARIRNADIQRRSISMDVIHDSYHPESKPRNSENILESIKEKEKSKVKVDQPLRQTIKYKKCVYCGKPAMPDDQVCRQCSSD